MKQFLDWSAYKDAGMGDAYADIPKHGGDYAKAIAVCINSGQCETNSKLVMCPSYKVSQDRDLSTGGRVRLLKAALGEDDWESALADPHLMKVMDLCVSCKGCKRECDNNVDMALIKAEYMAWRARREGLSLRSQLFAYTPAWLYRTPWIRHLIRLRNRKQWLRTLSQRYLGLNKTVALPEPAAQAFKGKPVTKAPATTAKQCELAEARPQVVLWVDTFTRHFEPAIADATLSLLGAAGYNVEIALPAVRWQSRPLCCGRTYLAQGLVDKARAEVARLAAALEPHAAAGKLIIGLEASCVLGLRDDALALGLGEPVKALSKQVLLLEEFINKEIMAKRWQLKLDGSAAGKVLVHGHCHQKAVGAMKSVRKVLKNATNLEFDIIQSGFRGMAGTFGLEAEHADIASDMVNADLIPALQAEPQAKVLANGFSCRQQMRSHGDNRAQHLAVVLNSLLTNDKLN